MSYRLLPKELAVIRSIAIGMALSTIFFWLPAFTLIWLILL